MSHSAPDVIRAKRDGHRLTGDQIDWVIDAYTRDDVAEEQMSALAMAILLRGMDADETARWTAAMVASGETLDLAGVRRPTVDKHSTGGVGDKITLALTPLVAACGAAVPQLSGRGLGHTGGTLDKLESIPGWRAELTADEIRDRLDRVGAVVCAATEGLAPADRKLYALRDVTATVESIPLIAASVMSKKLAEGTRCLVLDVKCGSGAFMKDPERGRELAEALVSIGTANGVNTSALLTAMSTPLGRTVGNALEVTEAVEVLRGAGPPDVAELTVALAREMLDRAGISGVDPAQVLASGEAYEQWCRIIAAQDGDPEAALPRAAHSHVLPAPASGTLASLDAYAVGVAAWRLGAGRTRRQDRVQHAAGVVCRAKPGERVEQGQPLLDLYTDTPEAVSGALEALDGAFTIIDTEVAPSPLILDRVGP
ncbi:thymidine phosphorylase [Halopolyspora algeriensis]|uniref:Thymidine phosphorylase n=1 Tax=Halopolyspora algeriensis TaxID=1500506 RepID=A0A368VCK0_9ACTN|nr:thymidine phosphorylase [Halopolyspora algeriensis]RCW38842.1 thymidine phosphorylase [Halopolyspora algeriensis]TQM46647.1 thymidine phosphorylase [Halopolyspora algeriensis]